MVYFMLYCLIRLIPATATATIFIYIMMSGLQAKANNLSSTGKDENIYTPFLSSYKERLSICSFLLSFLN